jgi:hypothetical protein
MEIYSDETKVLAFEGKYTTKVQIVVNNKATEQILNFNCLGYNIGCKKL